MLVQVIICISFTNHINGIVKNIKKDIFGKLIFHVFIEAEKKLIQSTIKKWRILQIFG